MRYPTPGRHNGAPWRIMPLSVHDGDTLEAVVDRGDHDTSVWTVRLFGVFAPELSQTGGDECRQFVSDWLRENGDGSDWPVLLETFRTPRSDVDLMTLSRHVGTISAANGHVLNDDVRDFIIARGYPGGVGS